jgi:hypothetical protein
VTIRSDLDGSMIYQKTVPVRDGAYALDDVPEPADTEITASVPGWPTRTRTDRTGGIQARWAGALSGPASGDALEKTQNAPLTYNFGGPKTPEDPDAPAYFLSAGANEAEIAFDTLSGKVYDQNGQPVPDAVGAKVIVDAGPGSSRGFHAVAEVKGGAYRLERVPTGVPLTVDLRINPAYVLTAPRSKTLIAQKVSGKPNVVNFGGPATEDDPEAPQHPFPSPVPDVTGPSPFMPR